LTEVDLTPKEIGGFRILRRLANGSTSDVLLARAEGPHGFQRVVALKILLARARVNPGFERDVATAASAYARLSHPAVVKLYDSFAADGQIVLVLEFVDGLPLHKLRAMLATTGERVEDRPAMYLAQRVFGALAAAHGSRDSLKGEHSPVIHGDVNPSNILVPWDGQVKLGDFGIARATGAPADTRAGFIKGTYGYSAPEQVAGKEVTERADIYSAGVILWELLARRKAVQRGSLNDAQVLKAMAHPEFPSLDLLRPDLNAAVRAAVKRAVEPDPAKRTITADEMVTILGQAAVAEDGRKGLAAAMAKLRATGVVDAGAASRRGAVDAPPGSAGAGPTTARSGDDPPLDPEQTAPFEAITEDPGELGKIAFYGRIRLPAASEPPRIARESSPPTPLPATPPVPSNASPEKPVFPADPATAVSPPPVHVPGVSKGSVAPRPVPRPVHEKRPSSAPSAPPPATPEPADGAAPLEATPVAAGVEAVPAVEAAPVVAAVEAVPVVAAVEAAPVAAAAHEAAAPPSPSTERSPEARSEAPPPPAPAAVEASRPDEPPHVPSVIPAAPRPFPWGVVAVVVVVLAAGAGVALTRGGSSTESAVAPQPSAPPSAVATPSAVTPPVAVAPPSSAASEPPAKAAAPLDASVAAAASAPSASASAPSVASAAPSASASAPPAPVASAAPSAAPPPPPPPASGEPKAAASAPSGDSGDLIPPAAAAGHRVFVDGKVAGEGSAPIHLHCGAHTVRIGSAGAEKKVDVPCGGTLNLGS